MKSKNSRNLLVLLVCACISLGFYAGEEGGLSKPVEEISRCEMRRECFAKTAKTAVLVHTTKRDWLKRSRNSKPSLDFPSHHLASVEQRNRNGFGGPLSC